MPKEKPEYQRVLLKLSGEALLGNQSFGINPKAAQSIAHEVKELHSLGVQVAIMIGGGNIFRGVKGDEVGIERVSADYMGMLATLINGIALQDIMNKEGLSVCQVSAIEVRAVAEPFIRRKVIRYLDEGRIVIFTSGIGSPYFTTDTAAAMRALEVNAEVILKATKVDGVYSSDPVTHKDAKKYKEIRYIDVLKQDLKVMDATAVSLCKDNGLPIIVFNIKKKGNIKRVVLGKDVGTKIY
ncbi:MAG: UMP kinase [Candidatus Aminicenantes bacterium]|nr:UMP kinase [Candidatus Aminicenantes bacterium]